MKDPEFILLRNRFLIALVVMIIFAIPIFLIIKNKVLLEDSSLIKSIKKNENVLIYVEENNCKKCKEYKKVLSSLGVKYYRVNKSKDRNYNKLLTKLKISKEDIIAPTLIYVENGNLIATLVDINNQNELELFVNNYIYQENYGVIE